MKRKDSWISPGVALLLLSGATFTGNMMAQQQDPPSRVARLAWMSGEVSFEPATVDQWAPASLNYPLTIGDNLYTDDGARAVLRIGRNSVRLNNGTNFQVVNLSDQVAQFSINSGSLSVRVRNLSDGESWEVDTPNGAVTLLRNGEYRIDCDPGRNATMVTVRNGDTEVTENSQSFPVHAHETAYFAADGTPPDVRDENPADDFDNFASSRDRMEDVPPPQYVSQDLEGYEDLNAYGSWTPSSDYGPVWYPQVQAGWSPYQAGRWAWVEPWGWTWVDDEPWGFAPFHYGRWAFIGNRWGWCPGPASVRPVYAPALVAFVGGGGFSLSLGIGGGGAGVAWFPLGPRDPFIPTYYASPGYVRNVNITNTRITNINITNVNVTNVNYMNRNVPGAVVAVPQSAFVSAQPIQRAVLHVTPAQLQGAQVIGMAPRVAPVRQSVLAAAPGRTAVPPPARLAARPVVAKLAPPLAPVSFQAKQQILQQHPGQPVAPQQLQTLRRQAPAVASGRVAVRPINNAQVKPITPPVQRTPAAGGFNAPRAPQATQAMPGRTAPAATPNANGQRFGQPAVSQPRTQQPAMTQPQRTQPAAPAVQRTPGNPNPAYANPAAARQEPLPPARPQTGTQERQPYPPARQEAAPVRQQPQPQVRPQAAPPVRQPAPPPSRQAAPQKQSERPPAKSEKKDEKKEEKRENR